MDIAVLIKQVPATTNVKMDEKNGHNDEGQNGSKKDILKKTKPKQVELMKKAKKAFDPQGIMNPGKLFDL